MTEGAAGRHLLPNVGRHFLLGHAAVVIGIELGVMFEDLLFADLAVVIRVEPAENCITGGVGSGAERRTGAAPGGSGMVSAMSAVEAVRSETTHGEPMAAVRRLSAAPRVAMVAVMAETEAMAALVVSKPVVMPVAAAMVGGVAVVGTMIVAAAMGDMVAVPVSARPRAVMSAAVMLVAAVAMMSRFRAAVISVVVVTMRPPARLPVLVA